jgi:uncharacterized lipoprotein
VAQQLSRFGFVAVAFVSTVLLAGCEQQVGPNDQTVSGKEYKEIVNSTTPENERDMSNPVRDSVLAPNAKR